LVRTDLTLPQQICQAIHAAYEAGLRADLPDSTRFLVTCQVPDEESLLKAQYEIERKGIHTFLFQEPDIGNQATALATEPIAASDRRKLSKYKLWEEKTCLV